MSSLRRRLVCLIALAVVLTSAAGTALAQAVPGVSASPASPGERGERIERASEAASPGPPGPRGARRSSRAIERWREASPAERREMRETLRERWRDASPRERRQLGRRMKALERRLPDFSPIERLVLLRAAAALPEAERRALRDRIGGIDDLDPEARARLVAELEGMIDAYDREVERLERNTDRWRGMSAAERSELRQQMQRLREMSVEERRALLDAMEQKREQEQEGEPAERGEP